MIKELAYKVYLHLIDYISVRTNNDRLSIKLKWQVYGMPYKLKLDNPITFNEKLQWLKLYNRKPIFTRMVDKAEAKKYVEEAIGREYIIPTIGVWDSVDEIPWQNLPEKFVIKNTHDSGGLIICKDKSKLDIPEAKKVLEKFHKRQYFKRNREWPYLNVPHRIICEQYMVDESGFELKDYKFFCFSGKAYCFKVDFDRSKSHRANYYDLSGNLLPFGETICPPDPKREIKLPENINEMVRLAEILSKDIPFLRVDFYNINGKIYFGELTFFPYSGFGTFTDEKWDYKLGELIDLNLVKQ